MGKSSSGEGFIRYGSQEFLTLALTVSFEAQLPVYMDESDIGAALNLSVRTERWQLRPRSVFAFKCPIKSK